MRPGGGGLPLLALVFLGRIKLSSSAAAKSELKPCLASRNRKTLEENQLDAATHTVLVTLLLQCFSCLLLFTSEIFPFGIQCVTHILGGKVRKVLKGQ